MHVAGISFEPDGTNADLGFVHVLFGEARGVEHGLGSALYFGLGQRAVIIV